MSTTAGGGLLLIGVLLAGCVGTYVPSYTGPSEPDLPEPVVLIVTIDEEGVRPALASGPRAMVQFINRDTNLHEIRSNPHPGHTDCVELNVGVLQPGHKVSILTPFESGRTCGYHDESRPTDARFQGSIVIR